MGSKHYILLIWKSGLEMGVIFHLPRQMPFPHLTPHSLSPSNQITSITFLILSCSPPLPMPSEQPQFVVAWTLQGVKSLPQGCWPMLTPMLLTGCVKLAGCPLGGGPFLILVCLAPTTIPRSKALKSFVLPIHPQWHTYTIQSQLSQGLHFLI